MADRRSSSPARKTTAKPAARKPAGSKPVAKPSRAAEARKPAPFLERTPFLEWLTAGAGLAGALGAIGFLVWEGVHADPRPPVLAAAARSITPTPQGYTVEIEVSNQSRATASAVQVEGVLPAAQAGPEETVDLTFDYVPGRGRREGSMTFEREPRGVQLRVKGQVAP